MNTYRKELIKYFDGDLDVSMEDGDETISSLEETLRAEPSLVQRFKIDGIEFGFIPNFDKIKAGEYIDLEQYMRDEFHLHKIMAILYRPIKKSKGKLYNIEKYEGTDKYSEVMKKVDFKIVKSAMVFFYNLSSSLLKATRIYIQNEQRKLRKKIKYEDISKKNNLMTSSGGIL